MNTDKTAILKKILSERIMVLDGAMGTMIQKKKLKEEDYRGERFRNHPKELKGANDVLCLTQPDIILDIHRAYLAAGADIIETDTFNSTSIALSDFGLEKMVREINATAARIARKAVDEAEANDTSKPRFPSK
ncbi:TPA: methionine synthase, partial [bacterium]|nr:methionine synthase [bacterium]